jgi:hypothetical protein
MAQGIIGGMTGYDDQSVKDIIEDINNWKAYTIEIKKEFEDDIDKLKERKYWNTIPFNFQMTLLSSFRCFNTYLDDFELILKAIKTGQLTSREVDLLEKIGINAVKYNKEYGVTFKEEPGWKDYGNTEFKVAENLYAHGRDFFVTLQDAANASARLNDYINPTSTNIIHNISQVVNGNGNVITGVNNGSINNTNVNALDFVRDIDLVLEQLENINDVVTEHKSFIRDLLIEAKEAVNSGDLESQTQSRIKLKSFLVGAGSNVIKIVHLLGTYSSIASYFQF